MFRLCEGSRDDTRYNVLRTCRGKNPTSRWMQNLNLWLNEMFYTMSRRWRCVRVYQVYQRVLWLHRLNCRSERKQRGDKKNRTSQLLFCPQSCFAGRFSKTHVKTTHVVNAGTAGKCGVMGQRNVKSHWSSIRYARAAAHTLKWSSVKTCTSNIWRSDLPRILNDKKKMSFLSCCGFLLKLNNIYVPKYDSAISKD